MNHTFGEGFRTCMNAIQRENLYVIDKLLEKEKEYFDNASKFMLSERSLEGVLMLEALSPETINNIQETAKLMVGAGFEKECANVYTSCRRECLKEFLIKQLLGLENLTIEDVKMIPLENLKRQIGKWIKASKVALKILFPIERRLSNLVFGFATVADLAFIEVCRGYTINLLGFSVVLANGSSPSLIFKILDMFDTLRDLIPEFESMFCDWYSVWLRNEANTVLKKLGEAIVGKFILFKEKIRQDPVKAVPGGSLHPVVCHVMNILSIICERWQTLEKVFVDYGHDLLKEQPKLDDSMPSSSSLSLQVYLILEVLENNLVAKSKIYNDPALCCVSFMNSSGYICQKIRKGELGKRLSNEVIQKYRAKALYNLEQYLRISWSKLVGFLKLDNNGLVPPNIIEKSMKEKLESFNILFEEICRVQSSWFPLNDKHRETIRISIERKLLPAYENFIGRFQSVLEPGNHDDKDIKYGMKDVEARLKDLFQGSSTGSTNSQNQS